MNNDKPDDNRSPNELASSTHRSGANYQGARNSSNEEDFEPSFLSLQESREILQDNADRPTLTQPNQRGPMRPRLGLPRMDLAAVLDEALSMEILASLSSLSEHSQEQSEGISEGTSKTTSSEDSSKGSKELLGASDSLKKTKVEK